MDEFTLKQKLIEVIAGIQASSGLTCPPLSGETKPVGDVPKFDSKVWPVATTILATEIGDAIPNDMNIFIDPVTKRARSIDDIAESLCQFLKQQAQKAIASA